MDKELPPAPHPIAPAVFAVPEDSKPGYQKATGDRPSEEPWSLLEEVLRGLVRPSPQGSMADWPELYRWLPEYDCAYPLLFPTDELIRYLEDDFQGILRVPLPQSVEELRRVLIEVVPKCVDQFVVNGGMHQKMPPHAEVREVQLYPGQPAYKHTYLPPGMPFPSQLVKSIDQVDVDVLHRTMNTDQAPLGFRSDEPLCYAWVALQYFAINAGTLGLNYDICGTPGNLRHKYLPPETVTKIVHELEGYGAPAVLFLCANASIAQSGRQEVKERKKAAEKEFDDVEEWATGLKKALRELVPPQSSPVDKKEQVGIKAYRARRLLMAPGVLPRVAIPREVEALGLIGPLNQLYDRINEIMNQVRLMKKEQDEIWRSTGFYPGTRHADLLRRAFLAVRDLIPVARSGRGRPRAEVNRLFGLWGVGVKEHTLNRWIREDEDKAEP